jgi:hypothetical protein
MDFQPASVPWFSTLRPVKEYPKQAQDAFIDCAERLLYELDTERNVVALVPRNDCDSRKIRVVESRNPQWYSELCKAYPDTSRKTPRTHPRAKAGFTEHDTVIRRASTTGSLRRIAESRDLPGPSGYDYRLREVIYGQLVESSEYQGMYCPPIIEIQKPGWVIDKLMKVGIRSEDLANLLRGPLDPATGLCDPLCLVRKRQGAKYPKPNPGVYFLFRKDQLVYIGKSSQVRYRIYDHKNGREHIKGYVSKCDGKARGPRHIPVKEFDKVAVIYCDLHIAELVEPIFISRYRPPLNKVAVDVHHEQCDFLHKIQEN